MVNRPRLNPLSILFVLGLLCYGVYTGVNRRHGGSIGIDVPGIDPRGETAGDTTVPVSSGNARDAAQRPAGSGTSGGGWRFPWSTGSQRTGSKGTDNQNARERQPAPPATEPSRPGNSSDLNRESPVGPANIQMGRVVKIVDGDTLEILTLDATLRIRLDGIDAPEAGQPFSRAARDLLSQLCFDQTVYVMVLGTDRYDRPLGDIYNGDVWVNGEMVSAGLAWWYRQYSTSVDLEQLEQVARQQRRGIWSDANPTPPWEYRRTQANEPRSANRRSPAANRVNSE